MRKQSLREIRFSDIPEMHELVLLVGLNAQRIISWLK